MYRVYNTYTSKVLFKPSGDYSTDEVEIEQKLKSYFLLTIR